MAKTPSFTKRALISKANSTIVAATASAVFLVVFALVASRTLVSQMNYQNRVISAKKSALAQLRNDLDARTGLVNSYQAFVGTPQNMLGGNPKGNGSQDGDNAKLVLDALPSQYDFPALATTLEKLITSQNLQITNIAGTDQELTQQTVPSSTSPNPVAMPFQFQVNGSYQALQNLVGLFEHSIRPFQFQTMSLSGNESNMTLSVTAQTFYQPAKSLDITSKVVQ